MSIDAVVTGFRKTKDELYLTLGPRGKHGPGRSELFIEDIPSDLAPDELIGVEIWGGDNFIMCGDERIGTRTSYADIRLNENAAAAVRQWKWLRGETP